MLLEGPETSVALLAKKASDMTGDVVVVHCQRKNSPTALYALRPSANSAYLILLVQHTFVVIWSQAKLTVSLTISIAGTSVLKPLFALAALLVITARSCATLLQPLFVLRLLSVPRPSLFGAALLPARRTKLRNATTWPLLEFYAAPRALHHIAHAALPWCEFGK